MGVHRRKKFSVAIAAANPHPGRSKFDRNLSTAMRKAWLPAAAWSGRSAARRFRCVAAGRLGRVAAARLGRGARGGSGLGTAAGALESADLSRRSPPRGLARDAWQEAGDDLSALLSGRAALRLADAPHHQVCNLLRRLLWHPARTRPARLSDCPVSLQSRLHTLQGALRAFQSFHRRSVFELGAQTMTPLSLVKALCGPRRSPEAMAVLLEGFMNI